MSSDTRKGRYNPKLTFGFVKNRYFVFPFSLSFKLSSYFFPCPFTSAATVLINVSVTSSSLLGERACLRGDLLLRLSYDLDRRRSCERDRDQEGDLEWEREPV